MKLLGHGDLEHAQNPVRNFCEGARKHGCSVYYTKRNQIQRTDLTRYDVIVHWSTRNYAQRLLKERKDVIILENAYLNNVQGPTKEWVSAGWNGLNGRADFLNKDMSTLLAGGLVPVHEKSIQESYRHADAKWFTVDYNQGAFAMKEIYSKYDKFLPKSYLQKQFSENFTLNKMTEKLGELLQPIESNITTQVPVTLPKLKKK